MVIIIETNEAQKIKSLYTLSIMGWGKAETFSNATKE